MKKLLVLLFLFIPQLASATVWNLQPADPKTLQHQIIDYAYDDTVAGSAVLACQFGLNWTWALAQGYGAITRGNVRYLPTSNDASGWICIEGPYKDAEDNLVGSGNVTRAQLLGCRAPNVLNAKTGICEPPYKDMGKSCHAVGNPINVSNGNKNQVEVDLKANGNGAVSFSRYYNSLFPVGYFTKFSEMGAKWRHTYSRQIYYVESPVSKLAKITRPDGIAYEYIFENNAWVSDEDVIGKLTELKDAGNVRTGWAFTDSDEVEYFDANGYLLSIKKKNGSTIALGYDASNRLTTVTGPTGLTLTFSYDSKDRIQTLTDSEGNNTQYAYDENANLVSVTYVDNVTKQYLYENVAFSNALTGIIDENNARYATWSYDDQGRAITSEHVGGQEKITITYNADGTSTVVDATGAEHTYSFIQLFGATRTESTTSN